LNNRSINTVASRRSGFLAAVPTQREALSQVDISVEISEPHDFSVRFLRRSSFGAKASIASRPTFVTMANAPLSGETGEVLEMICPSG